MKLNLDIQAFLDDHWQKKPLVIKKGFAEFIDPIDEHELAGLAQEEQIDSRIVSFHDNKWDVAHGPFAEFDSVCKGKWTLMVQAVDRWIEEVGRLADHFSFIPHWRFDDVMTSYAVPGAGVGPHVDQYDVFLIQGAGKRRWQVGRPQLAADSCQPHKDLQQVHEFDSFIDVALLPGDILYVPPGWPHWGESIDASITYSIGFRAPTAYELVQPLNDMLYGQQALPRYRDSALEQNRYSDEVSLNEINSLTEMVKDSLSKKEWRKQLLAHLSDQSLPLEPLETPFQMHELTSLLMEGRVFEPALGCKPLTCPEYPESIFINGQEFRANVSCIKNIRTFYASSALPKSLLSNEPNPAHLKLMLELVNSGLVVISC